MTSRIGRPSRGQQARAHLVLVRGGRDDGSRIGEDAAWRAFEKSIGWQEQQRALPDDFEERLLGRVVGSGASAPVAALVVPRPVVSHRLGTRSVALLVAAVVGVAAAALLPLLTRNTTVPATADPAAAQARDAFPVEAPPPPPKVREDQPVETVETATPPKPNGSRIARVARHRAARPGAHAAPPAAVSTPEKVAAVTPPVEREAYADAAPPPSVAPPIRWSEPVRPVAVTPVIVPRSSASLASFCLSPQGDRWFGASLPPPGAPIDAANAGTIGVMATVDFARLASF